MQTRYDLFEKPIVPEKAGHGAYQSALWQGCCLWHAGERLCRKRCRWFGARRRLHWGLHSLLPPVASLSSVPARHGVLQILSDQCQCWMHRPAKTTQHQLESGLQVGATLQGQPHQIIQRPFLVPENPSEREMTRNSRFQKVLAVLTSAFRSKRKTRANTG